MCLLFPQHEIHVSRSDKALDSKYITATVSASLQNRTLEEIEFENYIATIEYDDQYINCQSEAPELPRVKRFKPPSSVIPRPAADKSSVCEVKSDSVKLRPVPSNGLYLINTDELDTIWDSPADQNLIFSDIQKCTDNVTAQAHPEIGPCPIFDAVFESEPQHYNKHNVDLMSAGHLQTSLIGGSVIEAEESCCSSQTSDVYIGDFCEKSQCVRDLPMHKKVPQLLSNMSAQPVDLSIEVNNIDTTSRKLTYFQTKHYADILDEW